jgi:hypothetical protein
MAIIISQAIALSLVDAIHARIDAGAGPGQLEIYSGTRPANPEAAVPGASVLLVDFTLEDPAFAAATMVGTVATANAAQPDPVNGAANGTATWFRILDSDNVAIMDGSSNSQPLPLLPAFRSPSSRLRVACPPAHNRRISKWRRANRTLRHGHPTSFHFGGWIPMTFSNLLQTSRLHRRWPLREFHSRLRQVSRMILNTLVLPSVTPPPP